MLASLALAAAALRVGLRLRSARRRGGARRPEDRKRHLRLAKLALPLLAVGFAAGPVSALWLRGWDVFATLHAWIALAALLLFGATGYVGRGLERGRSGRRELHAALALAATLAGAAALITGLVLLP
jgi:hypothetical protein